MFPTLVHFYQQLKFLVCYGLICLHTGLLPSDVTDVRTNQSALFNSISQWEDCISRQYNNDSHLPDWMMKELMRFWEINISKYFWVLNILQYGIFWSQYLDIEGYFINCSWDKTWCHYTKYINSNLLIIKLRRDLIKTVSHPAALLCETTNNNSILTIIHNIKPFYNLMECHN